MIYGVKFAVKAQKELAKLPPQTRKRISQAVNTLARAPREGAVRRMVGVTSWRLRVGDYRIIYDIQDEQLVILIVKVAHRREVYRS